MEDSPVSRLTSRFSANELEILKKLVIYITKGVGNVAVLYIPELCLVFCVVHIYILCI